MPQEDYILRELEKLSQLLAFLLGLRKSGKTTETSTLVDDTFKNYFDTDLQGLVQMSEDDFTTKINSLNSNPQILEHLAKITLELALNFEISGEHFSAFNFKRKTLTLLYLLNEKDKTFSYERETLIAELENEFK